MYVCVCLLGVGGGGVVCWITALTPWPQSCTVMTALTHSLPEAGATKERGYLKRRFVKRGTEEEEGRRGGEGGAEKVNRGPPGS